jgi:hypothetical protein
VCLLLFCVSYAACLALLAPICLHARRQGNWLPGPDPIDSLSLCRCAERERAKESLRETEKEGAREGEGEGERERAAGSPASRERGRERDREKERESERETSACLPSLALPCLALLPLLPYCCTVVPSSLCVCLPFSCPLSSPSFYAEGGKYGARTRSSSKFWEVTSDDVPLPA